MIQQLKSVIGFQDTEAKTEIADTSVESSSEDVDQEFLKTRVENLELSPRTLQALETASIRTLGGLVRKKKDDILSLEGIGPKGMEEIEDLLTSHNLSLSE